ncbi:MAG: glycine dehydrogenase (aminomethyl-transferring) [Candidatus Cloacimonetes bacterium 4572_55]|nr:MAG: glycine dehydrogenase (aminomethyl-transferring) [Candidatus Cloacimonetes bacterium 4572_55]
MAIDLSHPDQFVRRHIGPDPHEIEEMVASLDHPILDSLVNEVVPLAIHLQKPLRLPAPLSEHELLGKMRELAGENKLCRSLIGMGYYDTVLPAVIQRNILENPGWYTQYTPYQAEISQGRLEGILIFQTMISDLTGMEIANGSLLDEATAAAEAMTMFKRLKSRKQGIKFFISDACHPQTIAVVQARAEPLGIEVEVGDHQTVELSSDYFGALVQYPTTGGAIHDYADFCTQAHKVGTLTVVAADLMSLVILTPPGEFGADAVVGSSQRFGVPMGYGGPHAAYFATRESYKRQIPGRLIGISIDSEGKRALRMALQTREQHIRREKATSNICTAQVLLAIISGMYAVYHGATGLKRIAGRIHYLTKILEKGLREQGYQLAHDDFFDTLRVMVGDHSRPAILAAASTQKINFRRFERGCICLSLDERSDAVEVKKLLNIFALAAPYNRSVMDLAVSVSDQYQGKMCRDSEFLRHPVFNSYHSETGMLRFIKSLEQKDLSLTSSMIPLGSCTMKLNAAAEMMPITWPEFTDLHPFAPVELGAGYHRIFQEVEKWLCEITGFFAFSGQPNSGAQGEYAGLMVIRAYHKHRNESIRNVCLIPTSAHGTNPASAVMAGMKVVLVGCDKNGNVDIGDLRKKAEKYKKVLSALMITYPSTHGVFEDNIYEICDVIHEYGGQVYMDGANMNAQIGLCRPADIGADVCHLNMHKTFAVPHGGGGPGMGPIGVNPHLAPFLPGHPIISTGGSMGIGPIAATPWGSPNIMLISWAYIAMMGSVGLTQASKTAILNANYLAKRLEPYYPVLYRGTSGYVAHEFILDFSHFKPTVGIDVEDVAKRLMDYGFHAPTVSFPVPGTMMIEPTESEDKEELDRFCEAMISIRAEIEEIEKGQADKEDNLLKNAPHTAEMAAANAWNHPYERERAVFPTKWTRERKFWPPVSRINNAFGDRNLVCSCPHN